LSSSEPPWPPSGPGPNEPTRSIGGSPPAGGSRRSAPERIGPYRLLEALGAGGMGEVWLAEQEQPIRRRVALKLIKVGMDTREVIARFEAERQALAMMSHPSIAAVLDAGATDEGRPYFAMEYVPGEPITAYCDRKRLSLDDRLGLFIEVCHAVQHAHQKAIIHRDLKPSNILVHEQDGKAVAKVIDFGIAKALGQPLAEAAFTTLHGALVGTPAYMSPEQSGAVAQDIDTRSDIYSLGVLLYELLTGTLPFDPKTLRRAGDAEIRRIIREVEPPKPSTRLSSLAAAAAPPRAVEDATQPIATMPPEDSRGDKAGGTSLADVAECRRSDPRTLIRSVRGDLDWIVMRCLEKDRARRYETANGLALEIGRFLRHEPVLAGPPTMQYRVSRFVRRHRAAVIAGSLAAMALVGATIVMSLLSAWALRERDRAEQALTREAEQHKLAEDRAEETRKVAEFQSRMLSEIDVEGMGRGIKDRFREQVRASLERQYVGEYPNRRKRTTEEIEAELAAYDERADAAQGVDVARRVMDAFVLRRAADAVEKEFGDQPAVQAQIEDAIGTTYEALGLYDEAEPLLRSSLRHRQERFGYGHEEVAKSLNNLAHLLHKRGDYEAAEPLFREALAINRRLFGSAHEEVAANLNNLGLLLCEKGKHVEAEQLYREALALNRKLFGEDSHMVTLGLNNLAVLYQDTGEYAAAEPLLREALARDQKAFGDEHIEVARSLNNLAALLQAKGDFANAEPLFREAMNTYRKVVGDEHPEAAMSISNLASLLNDRGDYEKAKKLLHETLSLTRKVLGDGHTDVAIVLNNLAVSLYYLEENSPAEEAFREALAIRRKLLGDEHPSVAQSLNNLAMLLDERGRYAEAEILFREALSLYRKLLGDEHPDVAIALNNLAMVLKAKGDYASAEPQLRQALKMRRKLLGTDHVDVANSLNNLAVLKKDMGDAHAAEPLLREAIDIFRRALPAGHVDTANARLELGNVLAQLAADPALDPGARSQRFSEAEELLLAAWETLGQPHAPSDDKKRCNTRLVELYDAMHAAAPDRGYDGKADEWRARLAEWETTTQPATEAATASQPADSPTDK